jgi:hypothetical protein
LRASFDGILVFGGGTPKNIAHSPGGERVRLGCVTWKYGGDWPLRASFDGAQDGLGLVLRHGGGWLVLRDGVEHGGDWAFAHVLRRGSE